MTLSLSRRLLLLSAAALAPSRALAQLPGAPVRAPNRPAADAETDRWMALVAEKGEHGSWLVLRGSGPGDQAVTPSHAAVLDKDRNEAIEAVARGVVVTPLRALLAQAQRLMIVRPPGWTAEAGRRAVVRARGRVGRGHDWLGPVSAEREARVPCTELAVDAYEGRVLGWTLSRTIFPADLPRLGTVLADTGPRGGGAVLEPRFARRLLDARGVSYAAEVAPGLYRGGQPDETGIAWLKSIGVKTIVNLRHYHGDTEGDRAVAAGLRYIRLPLESSDAPKRHQIARLLEILDDERLRPLYVHCLHGVDRTGAAMAVYRMEREGWSNVEAFAEMESFEAHRIFRDLRNFVRRYQPVSRRALR